MKVIAFRYVCVLAFQALDLISGFLKCKRRHIKLSSAKMATGLYKKMGFLVCLVASDLLSVYGSIINLHINLAIPVCTYLIVTESISIYENTDDTKLIEVVKNILKGVLKK